MELGFTEHVSTKENIFISTKQDQVYMCEKRMPTMEIRPADEMRHKHENQIIHLIIFLINNNWNNSNPTGGFL